MIQLTKTEALYIEEVLQEVLSMVQNEEVLESSEEVQEALNIIRACNVYSEEDMITLEEGYTEEAIRAERGIDE